MTVEAAAGRPGTYGSNMDLVSWAQRQASQHLGELGKRLAHSRAVASRAELVGRILEPADLDVLVAAAYLHDVGYAPTLTHHGLSPA